MKPIERDPLSPEQGESSPVIERAPEVSADPHQLVNAVHRRTEDVVTPAEGEHEINETVELIDVGLTFNPSAFDSKRDYWEMDIVLEIGDQEFHLVIPNDAMHSIQDDLEANFPLGTHMDETWWREFVGNRGERKYGALWNVQRDTAGRFLLPEIFRPFLQ